MTTKCFTPLLAKRIRVTKLDSCGRYPAPETANSYIVTDGFVTVSLSAEVEDGTEIIVRNGAGQLCVNERLASSFKRFNVEVVFCGVNPSLLAMMTNAEEYLDCGGDVAGITVPEGDLEKAFSFELWTGMAGQACAQGVDEASGYVILPFVQAGVLGDLEFGGEDAINFQLTGAYTKGGNAWGRGPYDVVYCGTGDEVQTVTITGTPTGGTFTLSYDGQATAPIAYNAAGAAVQTALEALPGIGVGNVTVSGSASGPFTVTFAGDLGDRHVQTLVGNGASLTGGTDPGVTVVVTTPGGTGPQEPSNLPTALDPLDHLLLLSTGLAIPPAACDPQPMPVNP